MKTVFYSIDWLSMDWISLLEPLESWLMETRSSGRQNLTKSLLWIVFSHLIWSWTLFKTLGFQFFNHYDDSDTDEMIGLSLSCLNFESTNWIFGNKIWIYQLLTKYRAKKGLVITKHHSFNTDLHGVADFKSNQCNISNTKSIGRSSLANLILFYGLLNVLRSEFLFGITLLLLLLWCFFYFSHPYR